MEPTYLVRIQLSVGVIGACAFPQGVPGFIVASSVGAFAYGVRRVVWCCRTKRAKRTRPSGWEPCERGVRLALRSVVETWVFRVLRCRAVRFGWYTCVQPLWDWSVLWCALRSSRCIVGDPFDPSCNTDQGVYGMRKSLGLSKPKGVMKVRPYWSERDWVRHSCGPSNVAPFRGLVLLRRLSVCYETRKMVNYA